MPKYSRYLVIAAVATAIAIPGSWIIAKQTDAFHVASNHISASDAVREKLGPIQSVDLPLFGYKISVTGSNGNASFDLEVKGNRDSGIAHVELVKQGTWRPVLTRVVLQDGSSVSIP